MDVVYFDYWRRGLRHFHEIDEYLVRRGFSTLFIHTDSVRGEPLDEDISGSKIKCNDISVYGNSVINFLLIERPKLVILLNNQTEDKIIIRACKALNIKTIYLMHGAIFTSEKLNEGAAVIDSCFTFRDRLKRGFRYINLLLEYIKAANLESKIGFLDFEIYMYFLRQFYSPGGNYVGRWAYKDSTASNAFVYSSIEKKILIDHFNYKDENVIICGNPNFDRLYQLLSTQRNSESTKNYAVYIENGLTDPKYTVPGWTEEAVVNEICGLAEKLEKINLKLLVKLHPSSDYPILGDQSLRLNNIEVVDNHSCDLASLILESKFVIGKTSTVLMMALAIEKPIFLISIPPLLIVGGTHESETIGEVVRSFSEFEERVQKLHNDGYPSNGKNHEVEMLIGPFKGEATKKMCYFIDKQLANEK